MVSNYYIMGSVVVVGKKETDAGELYCSEAVAINFSNHIFSTEGIAYSFTSILEFFVREEYFARSST